MTQHPSHCAQPRRRPRFVARVGFTLVELLVCMVVISLLLGILLPGLAKSREAARRTKCMVNLRSFGLALEGYRRDNKDMLPNVLPFQYATARAPEEMRAILVNDPALLDTLQSYMDAPLPDRLDPSDPESPFQYRDPYFCPSDKDTDVGAKFGISYEYWAGTLMVVRELFAFDRNAGFSVTRMYEANGDFPIMGDGKAWHKQPGNSGQNALYFADWHVDWLKLDNNMQQIQGTIQVPGNPPAPPPNP
ncbi:MAG: type II secretion system protein [Phycisphaerales bacterium]|nr:type II secretion system protein [Phycisphaerales bacterium]